MAAYVGLMWSQCEIHMQPMGAHGEPQGAHMGAGPTGPPVDVHPVGRSDAPHPNYYYYYYYYYYYHYY
eukprot:gene1426-biopygen1288